jgi:hypothetical protein
VRRLAITVLAALAVAAGVPTVAGAASAPELRVVTILRPAGGPTTVVADLRPAPTAPLPAGAAEVAVGERRVPATTAPLLDAAGRTALVVDASAGGAQALPEVLSGAAGFLLRLPDTARVTVVADGTPPRSVTPRPVARAAALNALVDVRPAQGGPSTIEALDLALRDVPRTGAGHPLVLLQTTTAPPQDAQQARQLVERLRGARAVLAVVAAPGLASAWAEVATPTGGLAVEAAPTAVADAFDEVAQVLRGRWLVTFVAPTGAASAELQVRVGGDVLTTDVPLSEGQGPAQDQGQGQGQQGQGQGQRPGDGTAGTTGQDDGAGDGQASTYGGRYLVAAVVIAVQLAVLAALILVHRRRGRAGPAPDEDVPEGVRVFDMSDPLVPVEVDPARAERRPLGWASPDPGPDEDDVHERSA